jgi:chromosomal replication initiator protein
MKEKDMAAMTANNEKIGTKDMAGTTSEDIWDQVRRKLRIELGDDVFSSWFASANLDSSDGGVVTLSVATRFLKSWIESHYKERVLSIWKSIDEGIWRVDVRVRSAARPNAMAHRAAAMPSLVKTEPVVQKSKVVDFTPKPQKQSTMPSADDALAGSPLDARLTFSTFVTGPSNRFAYGAAMEVATRPEAPYNPLFIHGSVGLGKSHLLQGVAWEARNKGRKVCYLTAERFMFGFVAALKARSAIAFKEALRAIDLLVVDDVQFLTGKAINDEFCHMLNALLDSGKQVVVAADRAPVDLANMDARARSRLSCGLTAEISSMDMDVRRSILEKKAEGLRAGTQPVDIPRDVLERIAQAVDTNGRDLEGAFNSLVAQHRLGGMNISVEVVDRALKDLVRQREPRKIRIEEIQKAVARHYNISRQDLLSARRTQTIVLPRQVAMYLSKTMTPRSLPEIGRRFGGKDHTTVLHAVRKIEGMIEKDKALVEQLDVIRRELDEM